MKLYKSLSGVETKRDDNKSTTRGGEQALLEVKNLGISFREYKSGLLESKLQVIRGLDITVNQGEVHAILGASGSGKSLLANAIMGLLPENAEVTGTINFRGVTLDSESQTMLRGKEIALVPQSVNSLDPLMKIGKQVRASIKEKNKKYIQRNIFRKFRLNSKVENYYPFQLSGGMARRVLASTAMVSGAQLIIADELTPGMDEHSLQETMNFIRDLANEGRGILFITHDINIAKKIADKVAIFYAGTCVEVASTEDFSGSGKSLRHPYTKALWNALPQNGFTPLAGSQPFIAELEKGCLFEPRCPYATSVCSEEEPESRTMTGGMVKCYHA
ncbi:ABC transporter ATP-binding protein [Salipaludibacillus sp. CF4.18]|uniref:ABC transporter ATP-binding protein n=1 Tax=Salipaludibacillus sp. CF4.18 TaxID=3373081 RepID=UPI003EE46EE8